MNVKPANVSSFQVRGLQINKNMRIFHTEQVSESKGLVGMVALPPTGFSFCIFPGFLSIVISWSSSNKQQPCMGTLFQLSQRRTIFGRALFVLSVTSESIRISICTMRKKILVRM